MLQGQLSQVVGDMPQLGFPVRVLGMDGEFVEYQFGNAVKEGISVLGIAVELIGSRLSSWPSRRIVSASRPSASTSSSALANTSSRLSLPLRASLRLPGVFADAIGSVLSIVAVVGRLFQTLAG